MKLLIVFLFQLLFIKPIKGQNIYYYYPTEKDSLQKGDVIILKLPDFYSCRFSKIEDFDILINLLENYKENMFRIEINKSHKRASIDKAVSIGLAENLNKIIQYKSKSTNYEIIGNGSSKPFILDIPKKFSKYNYKNRIEIFVN